VSGVDVNEAKEAITSFVNDVRHHLENAESYTIDKFGTFSLSSSDILHFTPDWDAFNLSFRGLEIIDLQPVTEVIPTPIFSKPPVYTPEFTSQPVKPVEAVTETNDIETNKAAAETEPEIIVLDRPEISEATTRLAWIILTSALILITVLCAYLAWDIMSDRKKIDQLAQLYPDTLVLTNEFDIPVKMDSLNTHHDSVPVTPPPVAQPEPAKEPVVAEETGTPCFVVVGAFSNPGNVKKMVERLEGLGYKATEITGGSLTRVAIRTSCDKDNLEKILNEARTGINPASWIY
jgi:cell division septation protein DedD